MRRTIFFLLLLLHGAAFHAQQPLPRQAQPLFLGDRSFTFLSSSDCDYVPSCWAQNFTAVENPPHWESRGYLESDSIPATSLHTQAEWYHAWAIAFSPTSLRADAQLPKAQLFATLFHPDAFAPPEDYLCYLRGESDLTWQQQWSWVLNEYTHVVRFPTCDWNEVSYLRDHITQAILHSWSHSWIDWEENLSHEYHIRMYQHYQHAFTNLRLKVRLK